MWVFVVRLRVTEDLTEALCFEETRDLALVPPDRGPIGEAWFTLRS